jgi:hypothetical protein
MGHRPISSGAGRTAMVTVRYRGLTAPPTMVMELPQTLDVDRTVVHPDTLQQGSDSCDSPQVERGLVERIEYVVDFVPYFSPIS